MIGARAPAVAAAIAASFLFSRLAAADDVEGARAPQLVFASLERTGCLGPCPVYRVDVLGDGTVVFQGGRFVKRKGRRESRLGRDQLIALDRAFEAAGFLQLETGGGELADAPSTVLAYATVAASRSIRRQPAKAGASAALARLEAEFGRIVELERWIGTEAEREALARRRPFLDDTIFRCAASTASDSARFVLNDVGGFTVSGSLQGEKFACRLGVRELSWAPDDEVGNLTIRMTPVECRGEKGAGLEGRPLQREMSVVVKLFEKGRPANVDWLQHAQPAPCVIDRMDEAGVRDAAADFDQQRRLPQQSGPPREDAAGVRLAQVMLAAVERGDAELVRRLLSYDAAARATNRRGQTPLAVAAIWNDGPPWVEIARVLVKAGAPLDARDGDGLTALGHAEMRAGRAKGKHAAAMIELLLQAGADPAASRLTLTVGGRSVALDHRTLLSAECLAPPGAATCEAARALARGTTLGLGRPGGANPGALICDQVGGDTVIARHASGDEDALCEFPDGSVVLAGRLYDAALQNDLRRSQHRAGSPGASR
jgi:hypothetical protein